MRRPFVIDDDQVPTPAMAIIDSDEEHAAKLEEALRSVGIAATVCQTAHMIMDSVITDRTEFVIFSFHSARLWRSQLKGFCETIRRVGCNPYFMCILRWAPDSPEDRLFGKQLNVMVVHEY